jgi:hypothetical protein
LIYALGLLQLRAAGSQSGPSVKEQKLIQNVIKRVRLWKEIGSYYSGGGYDLISSESRGTESVLNALILASHDRQQGRLGDDTLAAFENMWALEQPEGPSIGKQQADGGGNSSDLALRTPRPLFSSIFEGWIPGSRTPFGGSSDGFATAFIANVFDEAGLTRENPQLRQALSWLARNQKEPEGFWLSDSLNKRRNRSSDIGRFMAGAATDYAVLALT